MIMEDYKVLLTTSGIGSRLGDLTKFTNKSLVRIGKKPALSYIVESYPDNITIVVTLGHFGNQVKDFLTLTYPNKKFEFVNVDKYEGEGSSLLYSISCAKKYLQCKFIFNASDTIITEKIPNLNQNWLAGAKQKNSAQYRSFDIQKNKIVRINEKGQINYDYDYIGLCGIKDYKLFWKILQDILNKRKNDNSLSDCHVIEEMLKEKDFTYKEFNSWLDIGNVDSLNESRKKCKDKFEILDKVDESIFIFDKFVIKFFHDEKICKNRVLRVKYLNNTCPEILGYKNNFYKYSIANGEVLSKVVDIQKFNKLLNFAKDNLWVEVKNGIEFKKICEFFYKDKTIERVNKTLIKHNISDNEEIINGIKIPKTSDLIKSIDFKLLCNDKAYTFHGDFILDNIIYNKNKFKLIDWRQDFGGNIEYGDKYYDLAKLNHSLVLNHDIINKNLFFIKNNNNKISCDILRSNNLCDCQKVFNKFIKINNLNQEKINILTALIWLNMSPLHEYPLSLFLYYFGKYNLYINLIDSRAK
jgi:choline kinase/aminoglycoside phosphotransferase